MFLCARVCVCLFWSGGCWGRCHMIKVTIGDSRSGRVLAVGVGGGGVRDKRRVSMFKVRCDQPLRQGRQ